MMTENYSALGHPAASARAEPRLVYRQPPRSFTQLHLSLLTSQPVSAAPPDISVSPEIWVMCLRMQTFELLGEHSSSGIRAME